MYETCMSHMNRKIQIRKSILYRCEAMNRSWREFNVEEFLPLQIFHTPRIVLSSRICSIWGTLTSRYFTELQKSGFNLKVWMLTKINFRMSYLGILVDMKYENIWFETFM